MRRPTEPSLFGNKHKLGLSGGELWVLAIIAVVIGAIGIAHRRVGRIGEPDDIAHRGFVVVASGEQGEDRAAESQSK